VEKLSEREKLNKKIVREQQDSNPGAAVYGGEPPIIEPL